MSGRGQRGWAIVGHQAGFITFGIEHAARARRLFFITWGSLFSIWVLTRQIATLRGLNKDWQIFIFSFIWRNVVWILFAVGVWARAAAYRFGKCFFALFRDYLIINSIGYWSNMHTSWWHIIFLSFSMNRFINQSKCSIIYFPGWGRSLKIIIAVSFLDILVLCGFHSKILIVWIRLLNIFALAWRQQPCSRIDPLMPTKLSCDCSPLEVVQVILKAVCAQTKGLKVIYSHGVIAV